MIINDAIISKICKGYSQNNKVFKNRKPEKDPIPIFILINPFCSINCLGLNSLQVKLPEYVKEELYTKLEI